MKLDPRIKKDKRPLDCIDSETAKEFIGKKGYFANCNQAFQDLESTDYQLVYAILKEVDSQRVIAFTDDFDRESSYFLPEEWVKPEEPEKKYRSFSLEEFFKIFKVGDLIVFRVKIFDEIRCAMFTGYMTDGFRIDDKTPGACDVTLGASNYSLLELFKDYELFLEDKWQPFGVLDE